MGYSAEAGFSGGEDFACRRLRGMPRADMLVL